MRLLLTYASETTSIELPDGQHLLGGAPTDDVCIPMLPPRFLRLTIEGLHLTLEARSAISIDKVAFPGDEPRELLRDEVATLPSGITLAQAPRVEETAGQLGTRALFMQMLGERHHPPSPHLARLVCVAGKDRGREFQLGRTELEIGRGQDVQIRLRDRAVSRVHARLKRAQGSWTLEDVGAPNGVWLGGQRVTKSTAIYDGSLLELGRTVLKLEAPDAPRPPAPPPPPWALLNAAERRLVASCLALALLGMLVGMAAVA